VFPSRCPTEWVRTWRKRGIRKDHSLRSLTVDSAFGFASLTVDGFRYCLPLTVYCLPFFQLYVETGVRYHEGAFQACLTRLKVQL
jgi:hypothetical protein